MKILPHIAEIGLSISLEYFNEYLKKSSLNDEVYCKRALVYIGLKQYENALEDCKKAFKINPDNTEATIIEASVYRYEKKIDLSIKISEDAIRKGITTKHHQYNILLCNLEQSTDTVSSSFIKKIVKVSPLHFEALILLGDLYYKKRKLISAIKYYNQALKINKNDLELYIKLGHSFRLKNDFMHALYFYEKASEYDPENKFINENKVECYNKLNKPFEKFIDEYINHIQLSYNLPHIKILSDASNEFIAGQKWRQIENIPFLINLIHKVEILLTKIQTNRGKIDYFQFLIQDLNKKLNSSLDKFIEMKKVNQTSKFSFLFDEAIPIVDYFLSIKYRNLGLETERLSVDERILCLKPKSIILSLIKELRVTHIKSYENDELEIIIGAHFKFKGDTGCITIEKNNLIVWMNYDRILIYLIQQLIERAFIEYPYNEYHVLIEQHFCKGNKLRRYYRDKVKENGNVLMKEIQRRKESHKKELFRYKNIDNILDNLSKIM